MRDDPEATELRPRILQLVKAPSDFHGNCFFHYEFNQFSSTGLSGPTEESVPSSANAFIFNCMYVCMHVCPHTCAYACHSAAVDMGGQLCGVRAQFSRSTLNWLLRIELRSLGLHRERLYLPSRFVDLTQTF